jgi:hypothetical protein
MRPHATFPRDGTEPSHTSSSSFGIQLLSTHDMAHKIISFWIFLLDYFCLEKQTGVKQKQRWNVKYMMLFYHHTGHAIMYALWIESDLGLGRISMISFGTSKVSLEQRTRVQMSPKAQNDIKMHFYDFYQINLYVFNKFQIYFINYSGF